VHTALLYVCFVEAFIHYINPYSGTIKQLINNILQKTNKI